MTTWPRRYFDHDLTMNTLYRPAINALLVAAVERVSYLAYLPKSQQNFIPQIPETTISKYHRLKLWIPKLRSLVYGGKVHLVFPDYSRLVHTTVWIVATSTAFHLCIATATITKPKVPRETLIALLASKNDHSRICAAHDASIVWRICIFSSCCAGKRAKSYEIWNDLGAKHKHTISQSRAEIRDMIIFLSVFFLYWRMRQLM